MPSLCIALPLALALVSGTAFAQNEPPGVARATIKMVSADGTYLRVRTRAGEELTVRLNPGTGFVFAVPASLADVKPGTFIGVAAMPDDNDEQKAMDVHIFPEAWRGTGARVDSVNGPQLTVTYKGGQQTIVVDPKTPIVAFELGSREALQPGAEVLARGPKADDGSIDAVYVLIGKNGLVPPM